MRTLTLWQPWASLLVARLKLHETRGWPLRRPGWVAIHAAKQEPRAVARLVRQPQRLFQLALGQMGTTFEALPRGAVLGLALFGECVRVEQIRADVGAMDADFGDWTDRRYAWPVLDVWEFPAPVPARGRQGIWQWTVPADLREKFDLYCEMRA